MKRLMLFLCLCLAWIGAARAQSGVTVQYSFANYAQQASQVRKFDEWPVPPPAGMTWGTNILLPPPIHLSVAANPLMLTGYLTVSNLVPGLPYGFTVSDNLGSYSFTNYFPSTDAGSNVLASQRLALIDGPYIIPLVVTNLTFATNYFVFYSAVTNFFNVTNTYAYTNGLGGAAVTTNGDNTLILGTNGQVLNLVANTAVLATLPATTNVVLAAISVAGPTLPALNANNITLGTVAPARLPLGTTFSPGVLQPDGSTITVLNGVISSVGGNGGSATNAIPLLNGAGTNTTLVNSPSIGVTNINILGIGTAQSVSAQTFTVTGGSTMNGITNLGSLSVASFMTVTGEQTNSGDIHIGGVYNGIGGVFSGVTYSSGYVATGSGFSGSGSGLTSLPGANVTGQVPSAIDSTIATNLVSGSTATNLTTTSGSTINGNGGGLTNVYVGNLATNNSVAAPTANQYLQWSGTAFQFATPAGSAFYVGSGNTNNIQVLTNSGTSVTLYAGPNMVETNPSTPQTIYNNFTIQSNLVVQGNATVAGTNATGTAIITNAVFLNPVTFNGITNNGNFTNSGWVNITGNQTNFGNLVVAGTLTGNAIGLTNASRNLGVINYMSTLTNGNPGYDWTVANCTFPGQLGLSDYPGAVGEPTLWYGFTNGVGTNVWGVPFNIPAIQNLGNQNWQDIPNNPYEPMQFWLGMGPQQSSQEATWSSGTNNIGNYIQPDFVFRNANPWQGCCSLDMRAASTNSTFGYLAGNDKDGNPIYVSPFGFQIMEIGPQYVAGLANQAPSHCLLSSDSRFSTYFSLNGLRSIDSQYGQIPSLVLDTSTFSTQTNYIAEQHAHPLFRVPKQVANTWMVSQASWLDSLYIDTLTGAGTATNGLWTFGSVVSATNTSQYFKGNGGGLSGLQLKYQTNEIYTLTAAGYAYLAGISSTYVTSNAVVTTTAPIYTNTFVPDTNGIVAWYKMTEGTGSTTADSSGNGQTMTLFQSPSWVSGMPYSPVSSYAISFSTNGNIQYLTNTMTAFHATESNVTLTAWVYCIGNIQNSCVFDGNQNGTNRTSIGVNNGYLGGNQFVGNFLGTETSAFQSGLFIPTNQWAFVAMVATTTNNIMYLGTNSVSLSSATYPFATPTPPQVENGPWLIGGAVDVAKFGNKSTSMNGYISDVRIYNRPLSAGEITGIFNLSN